MNLILNCGSSSLKYALFSGYDALLRGSVENIGAGGAVDHAGAVRDVLDQVSRSGHEAPRVVGHRLVHGGPHFIAPTWVDDTLLRGLEAAVPFAPLHLPIELDAIRAVRAHLGAVRQLVCFDTWFHRDLPEVSRRFPLPASLYEQGIRRYGFHGLSYEYLASAIPLTRQRRAVFCHLGNGASMVAVRDGRAIDTTMGLTPTGGLVMGTRSGDLDPGVLLYLLDHGYDARALDHLVNHESGLLALSGTSADMAKLLEQRATDLRAALAIEMFCYRARKQIGAFAAALGGLETLVFTGGIGERSSVIRAEICAELGFLGVTIDAAQNEIHAAVISDGPCEVHVLATDEESVIAGHCQSSRASDPG